MSVSCSVMSFATPWTVAHQTPLSMEFTRQEHWGVLPFPTQGWNLGLPHCRHILYHLSQHRSPFIHCQSKQVIQPFCDSVSPSRMLKDLLKEWFQFSLLSLGPCSAESVSVGFYLILVTSLEKAMAPHSSTLAWKIPWMEEPGGLQSMGSLRVGHD